MHQCRCITPELDVLALTHIYSLATELITGDSLCRHQTHRGIIVSQTSLLSAFTPLACLAGVAIGSPSFAYTAHNNSLCVLCCEG